jgi:hypothetical protein
MAQQEEHWEADRRLLRDEEREPRRAHLTHYRPRRLSALASIHSNLAATVEDAGVLNPPVELASEPFEGETQKIPVQTLAEIKAEWDAERGQR